jgi:hypothetical protein
VVSPLVAAIATFVMILAAVYLLWMFQRVVLGEPSAFLLGLKHHLTDMTRPRCLTLAPLGALVGHLRPVPGRPARPHPRPAEALASVSAGSAIRSIRLHAAALGLSWSRRRARLVALRPRRHAGRLGSPDGRGARLMLPNDIVALGPFIAAVAVALAVLAGRHRRARPPRAGARRQPRRLAIVGA